MFQTRPQGQPSTVPECKARTGMFHYPVYIVQLLERELVKTIPGMARPNKNVTLLLTQL